MFHQNLLLGRSVVLSVFLALAGCASVDQNAAFEGLRGTVGDRVGQEIAWRKDADADAEIAAKVDALLSAELSFDGAVQVALFNNRELQAHYAEIGIANADLIQAGLLSNPVLDLMIRPTTNPSEGSILEFGLAQNVLDLFTLPARKKIATAEFEKARNEVAAATVEMVGEVRAAYVRALAARNALAVAKEITAASQASWELAQRFHQAGNISDLELAEERAAHEDNAVMLEEAEIEAVAAAEDLSELLGAGAERLKLPEQLPALPEADAATDNAVTVALERRLDMAAARKAVSAHVESLKLKTSTRLWQEIELKIDAEREPDGQWAVGPGLGLALPLFDQGGPGVARAAAELLKAENELQALQSHVRAEVRKASSEVAAARRIAERYRKTILPLKENIVRLKLQEYNFMLIGVFDVLVAKQEQGDAYLGYIEAVRDYWLARSELAAAMGGLAVDTKGSATP
jgi:cobalt-zinc-cadmium efflux system outer membrane protein